MRKLAFTGIVIALLISCSSKKELPAGILSQTKMEHVMWDLLRANEYVTGYIFNTDTVVDRTAEMLKWYDKIFQMNHTTKAAFEKSYAYYQANPSLMKEVLDSITHIQSPSAIKAAKDSAILKDSLLRRDSLLRKDSLLHKDSLMGKDSLLKKDSIHKIDSLPVKKILRSGENRYMLLKDSLKIRKR